MDSIEVRHAGRMVELVDVIAEAFAPGIVSALALLGPARVCGLLVIRRVSHRRADG